MAIVEQAASVLAALRDLLPWIFAGLAVTGYAALEVGVQARAEYNASFEWQTSEHSLLCPNRSR
jgi:hypothetical protein